MSYARNVDLAMNDLASLYRAQIAAEACFAWPRRGKCHFDVAFQKWLRWRSLEGIIWC